MKDPKEIAKELISQYPMGVTELLSLYCPSAPMTPDFVAKLANRNKGFAYKLALLIGEPPQYLSATGDNFAGMSPDTIAKALSVASAGSKLLTKNETAPPPPPKEEKKETKKIMGLKKPIFFGGITLIVLALIAWRM